MFDISSRADETTTWNYSQDVLLISRHARLKFYNIYEQDTKKSALTVLIILEHNSKSYMNENKQSTEKQILTIQY